MLPKLIKNPITRKRLQRFKEVKRAHISFWIMALLYGLSLFSEFICNDVPLYINFQGKSYFPIIKFYPEDVFMANGIKTRPDYKNIQNAPFFKANNGNYMVFAPIPFGPYESIDPISIAVADQVSIVLKPMSLIGTVNIQRDFSIARSAAFGPVLKRPERELKGRNLTDDFDLTQTIKQAVSMRFANQRSARLTEIVKSSDGRAFLVSLSTFSPRRRAPQSVRLTFKETLLNAPAGKAQTFRFIFNRQLAMDDAAITAQLRKLWQAVSATDKKILLTHVRSRFLGPMDTYAFEIQGRRHTADFVKEDVRFPFRPVKGHLLGIDGAGRDVLARILYGLRTSLTFGLLLVLCSMALGILSGALQGYYGGMLDITAQRLIEIWSALPFLYIMILMGSVYGRSFALLLFCYGLFNWIGISYYIRAEFLRLRSQPFVEAAQCMGISSFKVIYKHILPNALVPVITFFPFSLVGAIGSLAALDYLGFGLPPPTPSWGELLYQAQQYRWAWWLILYPSLALFAVMLFGVFVGEGIRNAYDPKRFTRLE